MQLYLVQMSQESFTPVHVSLQSPKPAPSSQQFSTPVKMSQQSPVPIQLSQTVQGHLMLHMDLYHKMQAPKVKGSYSVQSSYDRNILDS